MELSKEAERRDRRSVKWTQVLFTLFSNICPDAHGVRCGESNDCRGCSLQFYQGFSHSPPSAARQESEESADTSLPDELVRDVRRMYQHVDVSLFPCSNYRLMARSAFARSYKCTSPPPPPPPPPPLYRIVDDDARREFKSRSCWTPSTPPGYGHDPTHNSTEHSSCISRRKIWGEWLVSRLLLLLLLSTSVTATISSFLTSFLLFYYVYCSCCRWGRKSPKGPNRTVEFTSIYSYFTQGFVWFTTLILSAIRQIAKIWSTHLIFDWERYVHPHRGRRSEHQTDLWIVQRRNLCASIFLKRNVLMLVALASG